MELDAADLADKISPELREFVVNEQIKTQIRAQIRKLNGICFDKCVEKPGNKLEAKQELCIKNCLEIFLDANLVIAQRFEKRSSQLMSQDSSEEL